MTTVKESNNDIQPDVADTVGFPKTIDRISEQLAAVEAKYSDLYRDTQTLLAMINPNPIREMGLILTEQEKEIGVMQKEQEATLRAMIEERRSRIAQMVQLIQPLLAQTKGLDFHDIFNSAQAAHWKEKVRIIKENGIFEKIEALVIKAKKAFGLCKTYEECIAAAKKLASEDADFYFSQVQDNWGLPGPPRSGAMIFLFNSKGEHRALIKDERYVESSNVVTVQYVNEYGSAEEARVLGVPEININNGMVLHAGINLVVISKNIKDGGWRQSCGETVVHPHSMINKKTSA